MEVLNNRFIIILFCCVISSITFSQNRPGKFDVNEIDFKWKKTSSNSFELYIKPTSYIFNYNQDYRQCKLPNGNYLVFCMINGFYYVLEDFDYAPFNVEMDFRNSTLANAVFIRLPNDGFYILDNGINITSELVFLGYTRSYQATYGSNRTGKKYWIEYSNYIKGTYFKPYEIINE